MELTVNGARRQASEGTSVAELLRELGLDPGRVVVERNRQIVGRDEHGAVTLAAGDVVEIVQFVGGG